MPRILRGWGTAIRPILRHVRYPDPYNALKALTRTAISAATISEFVDGLDVSETVKAKLRGITPWNYAGM